MLSLLPQAARGPFAAVVVASSVRFVRSFGAAGEAGDHAGNSMSGVGEEAASKAPDVEARVGSSGFVPEADAHPSPEVAGKAGGPGPDAMGAFIDMMGAAVKGDGKRAARDMAHMARQRDSEVHKSSHVRPPHTTAQDWPRGSISDRAAASSDEAGAGTRFSLYGGMVPRLDQLPDVD